jgi:hypothetical protein
MILVLALSGCLTTRLVHKSEADIRFSLLEKIPVGTSRERVEVFIKQEAWLSSSNENGDTWAYLGRYGFFSDYRVSALWMFDKSGSLTNVLVVKRINSL